LNVTAKNRQTPSYLIGQPGANIMTDIMIPITNTSQVFGTRKGENLAAPRIEEWFAPA